MGGQRSVLVKWYRYYGQLLNALGGVTALVCVVVALSRSLWCVRKVKTKPEANGDVVSCQIRADGVIVSRTSSRICYSVYLHSPQAKQIIQAVKQQLLSPSTQRLHAMRIVEEPPNIALQQQFCGKYGVVNSVEGQLWHNTVPFIDGKQSDARPQIDSFRATRRSEK